MPSAAVEREISDILQPQPGEMIVSNTDLTFRIPQENSVLMPGQSTVVHTLTDGNYQYNLSLLQHPDVCFMLRSKLAHLALDVTDLDIDAQGARFRLNNHNRQAVKLGRHMGLGRPFIPHQQPITGDKLVSTVHTIKTAGPIGFLGPEGNPTLITLPVVSSLIPAHNGANTVIDATNLPTPRDRRVMATHYNLQYAPPQSDMGAGSDTIYIGAAPHVTVPDNLILKIMYGMDEEGMNVEHSMSWLIDSLSDWPPHGEFYWKMPAHMLFAVYKSRYI